MELSNSALKLRPLIEKAIEEQKITREDYDMIIHLATEDGHIDPHEKVLLSTLHDMIESKMIRWSR
jgi:hypothetical protein